MILFPPVLSFFERCGMTFSFSAVIKQYMYVRCTAISESLYFLLNFIMSTCVLLTGTPHSGNCMLHGCVY